MINMNFIKLELWRIWIFIFIVFLHVYLIYTTIHDYLSLKALSIDPAYGGNWKSGPMNFQLSCLLCSITLLPIILFTSIIVTDNLSNDGHLLGKDIDNNHFIFDCDDKGQLIRIDINKIHFRKNQRVCGTHVTLKQQFLPVSIFLQIISGIFYLLPLPFIEAQKIQHRAVNPNQLWHTDLDFLVDPDRDHEDFTNQQEWNFQLPMRPAYFNMIFCLSQLSLHYPSVFWRTNRKFSFLFCITLILLSLHILIDYSSTSILIRLALNQEYISQPLLPSLSPIIICVISTFGSLILILMQTSVFNYGLNQYFNSLARHRQNLRLQYKVEQNRKNSDPDECSNASLETLDVNDNISNDLQECDCHINKYISHIVAIIFGIAGMSIKTQLFLQNSKICSKTGDRIMYMNIIFALIFGIVWLIMWFGLTLHNTWQFKVQFSIKEHRRISLNHVERVAPMNSDNPQSITNSFPNQNSTIYNSGNPSGLSLVGRNFTPIHMQKSFDSCEENDVSNFPNYVILHNANNNKCVSPSNSSAANLETLLRHSLIKTKPATSSFVNANSSQIANVDESLGSETSFGSNQEKNRYNLISQDSTDTSLRHFVNRYYSSEHPNPRKEQRQNFGRSPLLSYQFSTESSPSDSQTRRSALDPVPPRVSFKEELAMVKPNIMSHKQGIDSKNDYNNSINIKKSDSSSILENNRSALLRSESYQLDLGNMNGHFIRTNSLLNQKEMKENSLVLLEDSNNKNCSIKIGNVKDNNDDLSHAPLEYENINNFDENNSEDERLCSQV